MKKRQDKLRLGAFIYYSGHHSASWRHPSANGKDIFSVDYYIKAAQIAERGKFDMMFLADYLYLSGVETTTAGMLDPVTLLSAIATHTSKLGLTATGSTTYNEPFHLARRYATLDHISKGRAAWNIVTSQHDIEAQNFGRQQHPEHSLRYQMAEEYVDVTRELWDSWRDDALVNDKENGIFTQPGAVREIHYNGQWYSSRGPLNVPRPPQGYPVLVVAGASQAGINFAAKTGEVVFTAQQSLEGAKAFYQAVHEQVKKEGRHKDSIKIMPGISPVLAPTEEEAWVKYEELNSLVSEEDAVAVVSHFLNYDLSTYPAHGPLPELPDLAGASNAMKSRIQLFIDTARAENLTIVELGRKMHGARGHLEFVGTPEQFVDLVEQWFHEYACDGFNIMPPILPADLETFVELAIPVLQERGLFRKEYEGTTLREHLGLERPAPAHFKKSGVV
ncbi:LLM class flavin-dependent oxidoreductase [Lysinibacillus macroides]|uniref:Nitrilotriacetate monooxygenase n=1 Tax=Lysinibacillus macroides TaxID=33935 RepID=A0A0M9DJ59_9BACI|nr:LLM class flavin-dependent oxidoreductase [Lysinibacillus macroides]KOY82498.1 nitrilotriacetate monooxygenase [Lysinibacillus macroides]QPR66462.1 LLM class flavin-dependent oxidoreductase [Lysinibacillus macroides]